jgi:hypothetical protein
LLRSLARIDAVVDAEVLIGLNGDGRVAEARRLAERYLDATRTEIASFRSAPPALVRNEIARSATAPVLLFLDDDVEVPATLLAEARRIAADPRVAIAGGPNLTPPSSTEFERLSGRVLASPVATGPLRHRFRVEPPRPADERTLGLSNLVVKRALFAEAQFDASLTGANENELLLRLGRAHGQVVSSPGLAVYHHRRPTLASYFRQIVKYGFGRGQLVVRAFSRRQLPYLVPAATLLAFVALASLRPLFAAFAAAAYVVALTAASWRLAPLRGMPVAVALFAATHVGYAVGVLLGLLYGCAQPFAPRAAARSRIWRW